MDAPCYLCSVSAFEPSLLGSDRIRTLKRAEYDRMIEMGLFAEDERLELLEGMLVSVSPQGAPHAYSVQSLDALLQRTLATRTDLIVRAQLPLALGADSEPEPDVAVVPAADYSAAHPTTAWLGVEVSQDSAAKDRQWKARIYAKAGIPEYWVVDLKARTVEVYREPRGERYEQVTRHSEGAVLRPHALDGVEVPVEGVLPPSRVPRR
jgi:Uma2 family endonuclease